MVFNQLQLEELNKEKAILEQELSEMTSTAEKYNDLSPQGRRIKELENKIRSIRNPNPEMEIGSEDPYKKPGVADVLEHQLKTRGDQMGVVEKAIEEAKLSGYQDILKQHLDDLKTAVQEYDEESQTKDKAVAVTDDELVPMMNHQLRWSGQMLLLIVQRNKWSGIGLVNLNQKIPLRISKTILLTRSMTQKKMYTSMM